jgi:hypothetical protein
MTFPSSGVPRGWAVAVSLGGLLLASAALGATYYVSPTGNDSGAGTPASPWTLAKANAVLAAGDVAILAPGNYGTARIAPANSGSAYGRFIAYVGNLADPASTTVGGVSFGTRSYVSAKGVRFAGDVTFAAPHDSLAWCVASAGDLNGVLGGDDCVAAHCTFHGATMGFTGGTNMASPSFLYRDSLMDCTFDLQHDEAGMAALWFQTTYQLYVARCRFLINVGPNGNNGMVKMYGPRHSQFVDCSFDLTSQRPLAGCDECNWVYFRDYFMFNRFLRDTFLVHGSQVTDVMLTASGSFPGTTRGNRYESCVFRQSAPSSLVGLRFQDGARADTMLRCTVVTGAMPTMDFYGLGDSCLFRNNTLVALGGQRAITSDWGTGHTWTGRAAWSDNILYSAPLSSGTAAMNLGNEITGAHWAGSRNLYFCRNDSSSAIGVWTSSGGTTYMGPGRLCSSYATDCGSRYGDPLFVGGSDALSFDVRLRAGSAAIGAGTGGGDIGAVPFAVGGDTTPPGTVTNLASVSVDTTRVTLGWTSAGDDGFTGTAVSCELRWSTTAITSANFASATAVTPAPTPAPGGTAVTHTVASLARGGTYYFALRTMDESGNWSGLSNVVQATLPGRDTTPPARIGDLRFP